MLSRLSDLVAGARPDRPRRAVGPLLRAADRGHPSRGFRLLSLSLDVPARPHPGGGRDRRARADVEPAVGRVAPDRGRAGLLGIRRLLLRDRALGCRSDALPLLGRCRLARLLPTHARGDRLARPCPSGRSERDGLDARRRDRKPRDQRNGCRTCVRRDRGCDGRIDVRDRHKPRRTHSATWRWWRSSLAAWRCPAGGSVAAGHSWYSALRSSPSRTPPISF